MATPLFNIGGLASGLDTNSIISQLMQIERIPVQQVQVRRAAFAQRNDAWAGISTRLASVRSAVQDLDSTADWGAFSKVSSSNQDAVGATLTGAATSTSVSFSVERLASAHQMAAATSLTSSGDLVGAGTFSITIDGEQHDFTPDGSTTLADLAASINSRSLGVSASLITVDAGEVKLVLTAEETGDSSQFTVTNGLSTMGTFAVAQEGLDARITLGSGPGAINVERSSNVIDDLIDGVSLDLKDTASNVKITINTDLDAAVEKVTTLVNQLNSALSTISNSTKAASEGGAAAGPLSMDSSARTLKLSLRSAISAQIAGLTGDYRTAASVGISLTREGAVKLDSTKLREALENDFDGVRSLFARESRTDDVRVAVTRASSTTLDGTHAIAVSQAATKATVTGSGYTVPSVDTSFDITVGSTTTTVTVTAGSSLEEAVGTINTALTGAGITSVTADTDSGAVRLSAVRYGAVGAFTVAGDPWSLGGTHTGLDVVGTIDGTTGTGSGRSLTGVDAYDGLVLSIGATTDQVTAAGGNLSLGNVTVRSGLAAGFDEFLGRVLDTGGLIDRATDRWDAQIRLADDRVEQLEERLERREAALRRQYASLETAMQRLGGLSTQLLASLGSQQQQ